jgi:hypothetical protein
LSDSSNPLPPGNPGPRPEAAAASQAVTASVKPASITRLHILGRLLWLCFYSVAMVALGNAMLFLLPQVQEGLWAFDDGVGDTFRRQAFFVFAFLYWAATTWYVARLTLAREFKHDTVGCTTQFTHQVAKWLPRLLSAAACLPLAFFLLGTGRHLLLGIVLVLVSALFLAFTWLRRHLVQRVTEQPWKGSGGYYRYSERLGKGSWWTLGIGFVVPHLVLAFVMWDPIGTGRLLGAPTLILLAIGAWALVGGMLLSYAPRTRGWPTLNWVPVFVFVVFGQFNDNHPIDWHAGAVQPVVSKDGQEERDPRPSLKDHYQAWMQSRPPAKEPEPVYFIASAGGASRASYWAGTLLGGLEDEARAAKRRFGGNIFLMSGISGGSVGIAAYAAALKAWPEGTATERHCFRLAMDRHLGEDVLSPVGAMMLFPDLVQRFLPLASQGLDRSKGLEAAWVADWHRLMAEPAAGCPQPAKDAAELWTQPLAKAQAGWPGLVLNTARLEDGRRILQSNIQFDLRDADDLLGAGFEARARHISLVGAAHNSARFPLVSPPGSVRRSDGVTWGFLGDGGYHEVTGSATLADIIEALIAEGCLYRSGDGLHARAACDAAGEVAQDKDASVKDARVVVVMLDNTPSGYPKSWQRDADGHPLLWPVSKERSEILRPGNTLQPVELTGPVVGLLSLNGQVGRQAEQRLAALAGPDARSLVELRLPRFRGLREPSMNWQLDRESRGAMMCATWGRDAKVVPVLSVPGDERPCNGANGYLPRPGGVDSNLADEALRKNLDRLREWIGIPGAAGHAAGAAHARTDNRSR